jgi:hypothetical protein
VSLVLFVARIGLVQSALWIQNLSGSGNVNTANSEMQGEERVGSQK